MSLRLIQGLSLPTVSFCFWRVPANMLVRHETFAFVYHFIFKQKLFFKKRMRFEGKAQLVKMFATKAGRLEFGSLTL